MESVIQKEKRCLICHAVHGLHRHHVYYGPLRGISEKHGLTVWLCGRHHNMSNGGVHFDRGLDLEVKRYGQRMYERSHSREEFIRLIGKNYL